MEITICDKCEKQIHDETDGLGKISYIPPLKEYKKEPKIIRKDFCSINCMQRFMEEIEE